MMPQTLWHGKDSQVRMRSAKETRTKVTQNGLQSTNDDAISKKRERKRANDRLAQQEHRKRQKQYIEELEAKVDFLTNKSSTDKIATLMRENKKLHEELQQLRTCFEGVQQLIGKIAPYLNRDSINATDSPEDEATYASSCNDQLTPSMSPPPPPQSILMPPSSTTVTDPNDQHSYEEAHFDELVCENMSQRRNAPIADISAINDTVDISDSQFPTMEQLDSVAEARPLPFLQSRWQTPVIQFGHPNMTRHPACILPDDSFASFWPAWSSSDPLFVGKSSLETIWPNLSPLDASQHSLQHIESGAKMFLPYSKGFPLYPTLTDQVPMVPGLTSLNYDLMPARPLYRCLPALSDFVAESEVQLLKFLQLPEMEMRRQVGDSISKPSVMDFLIDNPTNLLSLKVKAYIAPLARIGKMPEMLASFWIISLILRWYIIKDEETFNAIPLWLRPTELQKTINHPMNLWFMPWPSVRDAAITTAISDPQFSQDVMQTLGQYLEVDLSGCSAVGGSSDPNEASRVRTNEDALIQSIDTISPDISVPRQESGKGDRNPSNDVDQAIRDLRNWKLHDGFFSKFPAWKVLYHQDLAETIFT